MRLIKFSLIVMGLLIIAGFLFVGYVSYQRMSGSGTFAKPSSQAGIQGALADLSALTTTPSIVALGLPNDARIEEIKEIGSYAMLLIRQPGASDQLYFIDPRTGGLTGAIGLGTVVPSIKTVSPAASASPAAPTH